MTKQHHMRRAVILPLTLAALAGLITITAAQAADRATLIPGYVDADGTVHPEKLLSYVDALHRADDANKAEARIVQLNAQLSRVVATLAETRQRLAQQSLRAKTAEQLADKRSREISRLAKLYKDSQSTLATTRNALTGQSTRATRAESDRDGLKSRVGRLITSVQLNQTNSKRLSNDLNTTRTQLDTTRTQLDSTRTQLKDTRTQLATTTSARMASKQVLARLNTQNSKLDSDLKSVRNQLRNTTKSLATTAQKLRAAQAARTEAVAKLKDLADKTKPVTVEPDSDSPAADNTDQASDTP